MRAACWLRVLTLSVVQDSGKQTHVSDGRATAQIFRIEYCTASCPSMRTLPAPNSDFGAGAQAGQMPSKPQKAER